MPRSLTSAIETAIGATITEPVVFLEIGFSVTVRYASRGTVSWNGYTWSGAGLRMDAFEVVDGVAQASVVLANQDQSLAAYILNQGGNNLAAKLWLGDAQALATADPVLLIDGVTDGATITADECRIGLLASSVYRAFAPRQICAPPLFNHLPPRGTTISWGGDTYILEGR